MIYKFRYPFLIRFFSNDIDLTKYRIEIVKCIEEHNKRNKSGQINPDFGIVPHGMVLTYDCKANLKCPGAALSLLSKIFINKVPQFSEAVVEKRLFRIVQNLPSTKSY